MGRTTTSRPRMRTTRPDFALVLRKTEHLVKAVAERTCRKMAWSRPAALAQELMRALYCKAVVNGDAMDLSLPPHLDTLWHALILETRDYAEVCKAMRTTLHHTAVTEGDALDEKNKRVQATLDVYALAFPGETPDAWCWEREDGDLFCKCIWGKTEVIKRSLVRTVWDLKRALARTDSFGPADMQRVIYAGRQMEDNEGLSHLPNGATLFIVGMLRGC